MANGGPGCICPLSQWLGKSLKGDETFDELAQMLIRPNTFPAQLVLRWMNHGLLGGVAGGLCIGFMIQLQGSYEVVLPLSLTASILCIICLLLRRPMMALLHTDFFLGAYGASFSAAMLLVVIAGNPSYRSSIVMWTALMWYLMAALGIVLSRP